MSLTNENNKLLNSTLLKSVFSLSLIFAFTIPFFINIQILVSFKLDQQRIAKELCVNRNKMGSTCNGKCYLMKKLKAAEENSNSKGPNFHKEKVEILFFDQKIISIPTTLFCLEEKKVIHYNEEIKNLSLASIFRPPQLFI